MQEQQQSSDSFFDHSQIHESDHNLPTLKTPKKKHKAPEVNMAFLTKKEKQKL